MKDIKSDVIIVGCGASGLYCALNLPRYFNISILSKDALEKSDSFLAQGGICVLKDSTDYDSYFEDTMKSGHYENNPEAVSIMIHSSKDVINDLLTLGTDFAHDNGAFIYTKEGAHSQARILYHEDETGKEITSKLLQAVQNLPNVTFYEYTTMTDLICENNCCQGILAKDNHSGEVLKMRAYQTVLATGGIGGLYENSTNYPHLTGDAIKLAQKYAITLKNLDYVQIHPTTLYSSKPGRRFLISESVRGEGALLYDKNGNRFANELLPRDLLTQLIHEQMKKDNTPYVYLSMAPIGKETLLSHFPHIYAKCLEEGLDPMKDYIPVVPAQHYFMGGISVDSYSHTSMKHLYAIGETACNGVHGANRLASNSLLESLVFAKRAARQIGAKPLTMPTTQNSSPYHTL